MITIEKRIAELEAKGRSLITEIVPLIGQIPKAALSEVTEFLADALETAKLRLDITKKETERTVRGPSWASRLFMTLLILFLPALSGCGYVKPTENQRQANQQVIGAGAMIEAKAIDPEIKTAGSDVKNTAQALQDVLIGKPETVKPYSHEESVRVVTIVKKEYDESKAPWYKRWAGTLLAGLGGLSTLLGVVGYFYPPAGVAARILKPVAAMLTDVKVTADAETNDSIHIDTFQQKLTALTKIPGVGPLLNDLLAKAHLTAAVHAPEGPDPATPTA